MGLQVVVDDLVDVHVLRDGTEVKEIAGYGPVIPFRSVRAVLRPVGAVVQRLR